MNGSESQAAKKVRIIPPTIDIAANSGSISRQLRVVAYCRVSTKMEEQLNSYETQVNYYTDKINSEPKWELVKIFADKGNRIAASSTNETFKHLFLWGDVH